MQSLTRIVADRFGGPDVLRVVRNEPLPEPGPRQVRVRVEAAGIGFTDIAVRRGKYFPYRGGTPFTPGYDIVGTVDRVGNDVAGIAVGDRVADITVVGGYTTHIVRPASSLVTITADLDPALAVCIPLVWVTAWQMLTRFRDFQRGDWVLVVGASGGVGIAMLELARYLGLRAIGTCAPANFARVIDRGAIPVDYNHPELAKAIRSIAGAGVKGAFDAIGGISARTAHSCLTPDGLFVSYGAQGLTNGTRSIGGTAMDLFRVLVLWNLAARFRGGGQSLMYLITSYRKKHPEHFISDVRHLCDLMARDRLTPPAIQLVGFDQVSSTHASLEAGKSDRKFVISPGS